MYSSQDDIPMPLPTQNFTNNRRATKREHRGSSAGLPRCGSILEMTIILNSSNWYSSFHPSAEPKSLAERPATAQPEKTSKSAHSTQPPSPTYSAWGGGSMYSSHSTLNRPVSAGPFQRMEARLDATAPSGSRTGTAPLIEAIQSELRKFKQQQE